MSSVEVLVVGAGAAGIAAARALRAAGQSALVLEARERIGGRAWTDTREFGVPVDLGCAWLHSAEENPWTRYAQEHGFTVMRRDPQWQRRIGREEAGPEYQASWLAAWHRNERLIESAARDGFDVAVSDVIPDDDHRSLFDAIMGWLMGSDSASTSTLDFARYQDTDANWAVAEGLGTVVAHAGRDLDVQISTEVTCIESARGGFRVHTSRGVIACKAVVVTVSTTLMLQDIRFDPPLPTSFMEALHGVPLGVANKVFYRLKPGALPWPGMLHFTGTNRTSRTASYGVRPGGQELLVAFFGGTHARELEQRGELDAFARAELGGIFGADFLTQIEHAYATKWASDVFARGSYSSAMPGRARDREVLREPPREGMFYAGEATSLEHFGTIHGAWASGVRAAELLMRHLRDR